LKPEDDDAEKNGPDRQLHLLKVRVMSIFYADIGIDDGGGGRID
jgi:hypothetical protein